MVVRLFPLEKLSDSFYSHSLCVKAQGGAKENTWLVNQERIKDVAHITRIQSVTMAITKEKLKTRKQIDKVVIHSHDLSLYLVSVFLDGEEHYVVDRKNKPIREFSKQKLQALFQHHVVAEMVLRQQSAYDEMIGQPLRDGENTLEVPIGNREIIGRDDIALPSDNIH